jgi:membrane dipeptidase
MGISRREFVKAAGMGAAAMGLSGAAARQAAAQDAADRFHDWIFIDALAGVQPGEESWDAVKRSGITMIDTTMGPAGKPTFSYEQAVQDLATWHGIFDRLPDHLIRVRTTADILEAKQTGKLAVMLGFQNGTHLDRNIDNVEFFYNLGIRQMLLTYNSLNALGAGCTARKDAGLSHFGVEVVEKMNELGMIVDLAHCGIETTLDAVEVSSKPVLFTHNCCRALCDNARNKTDEEIRAMAAKGGVMGIDTVNFFVSKKEESTLDDLIAHFEHAVEVAGIDHVGIGSDSPIEGWRAFYPDEKTFWDFHSQFKFKPGADVRWPPFIEEVDVPEKFFIIADRLSGRGFSDADLKKILGDNFMRVYAQILG